MPHLTRGDLWSLEKYSEQRDSFRREVLAHKRDRQLSLGENARIYFEDTLTIRYQIQEMLRIEKVFDVAGIEAELAASAMPSGGCGAVAAWSEPCECGATFSTSDPAAAAIAAALASSARTTPGR